MEKIEFIRKTRRVGNSSGILLPKNLLGSEVKVTVIKRPINIKKEVFKLLDSYFPELRGIYITNQNPIEVLAISSGVRDTIGKEKMKINIVPLPIIKRDIKTKQKLREKLLKAKSILNRALLLELKKEIKGQV